MDNSERPPNLPHGRWLGDFGTLSAAEKHLIECAALGVNWMPEGWNLEDRRPEKPTSTNRIRAGLIPFLLKGGDAEHPVARMPGILCAWIEGEIDISLLSSPHDLLLIHSYIEEGIEARQTEIALLCLSGSFVGNLNAQGAKVAGPIHLNDGFWVISEINLAGAHIGGQLNCSGGRFDNPGGNAITAQNTDIKDNCIFSEGFFAKGTVSLCGAHIGGQLNCNDGRFDNPGGHAINIQSAHIKSDCFFTDGFYAKGTVCLSGTQIGGQLICNGGIFDNPGGNAINIQSAQIKSGCFFKDGFHAKGVVDLSGLRTGGQLTCSGGRFENPGGDAINVQNADIKNHCYFNDGFHVTGAVNLSGSRIDGQLGFRYGSLNNPDGFAIKAESVKVAQGLFFCPKEITGIVNLAHAHVAVLVDTVTAWPEGAYILDGFRYDRMNNSHDAPSRITWLNGQSPSKLKEEFSPQPWEQLTKVLRETGHNWAASEVAIAKQKAMFDAGQIGQRRVKEFPDAWFPKARKWIDTGWNWVSNTLVRTWHKLYGAMSGYGYRPQRILYLLFAFICLSSVAYYEGRHDGLIGPTNPIIHLDDRMARCGTGGDPDAIYWTDPACPVPPEYSTFQPFLYALDVTLPLVDLHQEADWGPVVTNKAGDTLWAGRLLRWLMWANIIIGWIASLMFVAIVSRLVEKD